MVTKNNEIITKILAVLLSYLIIQSAMVSCPVTCSANQPAETQHDTDELSVLTAVTNVLTT